MASTPKWFLTVALLTFWGFPSAEHAAAQTQLVSGDYFPAELEFKELRTVNKDKSGDGATALADNSEAPIFAEAGFLHYARRSYTTESGTELTIEVLTAKDEKAAYSLLTLLRSSKILPGPPGDSYAEGNSGLVFARGSYWVRIVGNSPVDLYHRIAISVSNRIGSRKRAAAALISRFPQAGLDPDSVRYFLGPIALGTYGTAILGSGRVFGPELEIAQANYAQGSASGLLSLISFPTSQAAESFFDGFSSSSNREPAKQAVREYAKRAGPVVGILQGGFDPAGANEILQQLKYTYSITWIYNKNEHNSATLWGVPVGILGTVVRSIALTALLCGLSIFLGVSMAMFRVFLRGYAPNNFLDKPERTEMIRLRLNEGPIPPASSSSKAGMTHN